MPSSNWQHKHTHTHHILLQSATGFAKSSGPRDEYTFTSVLKACTGLAQVIEGEKIHCFVAKNGRESNLSVRNSLADMHFKVDNYGIAQQLFAEMGVRDVSWNTSVSGYCLSGQVEKARWVFDGMVKTLFSWSTMISAYAKLCELKEAWRLFNEMPKRNVVSWNAMIAGYAQNEKYAEAIDLFRQMQQCGLSPNDVTLVSVLSACAHLGALDLGKCTDRFITLHEMELGLFLGNALVDMSTKSGCIAEAKLVLGTMHQRDVISWSIIITVWP